MKILFINRYYSPDPSGTSRMLTDLATDLARSGHRVTVIASDADTRDAAVRYPGKETLDGVRVRRVRALRFDRRAVRRWVLNSLSFYPRVLIRALRLPRQDAVVFLSDPPLVFALGPVLRRLKGSPYVCWCQDVYPEVAIRLGILRERSAFAWFLKILSGRALRSSDGVIAVGERMSDLIRSRGVDPERIRVRPNWADGERVRPVLPEANRFLEKHGLRDKFIILYSGNMGLAHPFETVLGAAARLKAYDDIVFVFIGGGKQRRMLEQRSSGRTNIVLMPFQDEADLAQSLCAGDLHLVTLRPGLEGAIVPSKLYGALAAGRPVLYIGPAGSEAARVVEEAECGYVIAEGDVDAFCRAVLDLYRQPERRRLFGERARKVFESRFDRPDATRGFGLALVGLIENVRPASRLKRALDLGLSGVGLVASAPLWAVIACLVKGQDGGPVFHPQERVGRDGRIFTALKFRSMIPDAEAGSGPVQAAYNDPRVTRVGRVLRATAMDELPQLWNIFRGDMSFVGPRALRPLEIEAGGKTLEDRGLRLEATDKRGDTLLPRASNLRPQAGMFNDIPNFHLRHRVRPGLTGPAQVYAPRNATRRQKLRYDLLYVRSRSFGLDLKLIALSFLITFRGRWEAKGKKV
ncbi:MAG TPA: sugar transferase [Nitrospiria bacterium]|nr:sugar transferase [Nitrospiria bacterium]